MSNFLSRCQIYPKTRYFNVEYIIYKDECWQHWILFFCLHICQKISALDKIFVKSKQYLAIIENLPNDESRASSNTVFFSKMNCLNSQFTAPFQDHALCTEFLLRIAHANSKTLKHCINTSKICLSEHKSAKHRASWVKLAWVRRLKNVWFIPPQKNCRNHSSIVINVCTQVLYSMVLV